MRCAIAVVLAGSLVACAEIRVTKVDKDHPYVNGVRFCRPAFYLIVGKDKDNALTNSIIIMPDKSDEYVARVYNPTGLSKAEFKVALKDGWQLAEVGGSTESPVTGLTDSFAGVVKAFTAAAGITGSTEIQVELTPGWYRIEFDGSGQVAALVPVRVQLKEAPVDTK